MTLRGTIKGDVVVLEPGPKLPDGTLVRVQPESVATVGKTSKGSAALEADQGFAAEFSERAVRWEKESSIHSSPAAKFLHEDYQFIMAKGEAVVPLILRRLE